MSHGHSHAPGEDHGHSHGGEDHGHSHGPGEDHGHAHGPQQPQQQQIAPDPDPLQQAVIDASFTPIDLLISPDTDEGAHGAVLLCRPHQRETCADCGLDFGSQNRIARVLVANPNLLCPPPAKVVNPQVTQFVTQTKEEGNVFFKKGQYAQAIEKYTISASIAIQRPAWEAQQIMREELSAVLSNRSAANCEAEDFIGALVDAEQVIQLKRNWTKGHFRKAKALLGMKRYEEARDAVELGLAFEPTNGELVAFRDEIIEQIKTKVKS